MRLSAWCKLRSKNVWEWEKEKEKEKEKETILGSCKSLQGSHRVQLVQLTFHYCPTQKDDEPYHIIQKQAKSCYFSSIVTCSVHHERQYVTFFLWSAMQLHQWSCWEWQSIQQEVVDIASTIPKTITKTKKQSECWGVKIKTMKCNECLCVCVCLFVHLNSQIKLIEETSIISDMFQVWHAQCC
jgi:hypothetical protein